MLFLENMETRLGDKVASCELRVTSYGLRVSGSEILEDLVMAEFQHKTNCNPQLATIY